VYPPSTRMESGFRLLSRTLFRSMRLLPLAPLELLLELRLLLESRLLLELLSSPLPVSSPRWVPGWSPSCRSWCAGMARFASTSKTVRVSHRSPLPHNVFGANAAYRPAAGHAGYTETSVAF